MMQTESRIRNSPLTISQSASGVRLARLACYKLRVTAVQSKSVVIENSGGNSYGGAGDELTVYNPQERGQLKAFRKRLRRAPFYSTVKALGHYPDYWYWILRGKPLRSPHLLKQRTVQEYGEKFGLRILVETGTYYGEMVSAMHSRFDVIYSIEQDPDLAARATREFSKYPHIRIIRGDSQAALADLLKSLDKPALFWLDAGYYGWSGMQGDKQRLGVELDAILRHGINGHVILMDDAHGLNGKNGALTIEEVTRQIEMDFPNRKVEVAFDILRITPAR
jgi:hypothetical protein